MPEPGDFVESRQLYVTQATAITGCWNFSNIIETLVS